MGWAQPRALRWMFNVATSTPPQPMFSVFARLAPCKSVDFRLSPPINGQQVSPFQRLALYVVELMGISSLARRAAHNLKSAGPNLTEQLITATHFRRVTKPRLNQFGAATTPHC